MYQIKLEISIHILKLCENISFVMIFYIQNPNLIDGPQILHMGRVITPPSVEYYENQNYYARIASKLICCIYLVEGVNIHCPEDIGEEHYLPIYEY